MSLIMETFDSINCVNNGNQDRVLRSEVWKGKMSASIDEIWNSNTKVKTAKWEVYFASKSNGSYLNNP